MKTTRANVPWVLAAAWLSLSGHAAVPAGGSSASNLLCFTYKFDQPEIQTNGEVVRLSWPEAGQLHKLGQPAMPFRTARLLIPAGCTVTQAEAMPLAEAKPFEGTWRVEFAGEAHHRPGRGKGEFTPGLNRLIYRSDNLYPASAAELLSVQRMAGYDIALVRLFPVRYKPASGQLVFTPELRLTLTLGTASTHAEPPLRSPQATDGASRVAAFVDNPELLPSLESARKAVSAPNGPRFDYLLVTSRELAPAFQPLVERKTQDGLAVKVAFLETITNSVAGRDGPEQIRNYIRQAYTNWGISYVLLGGATSILPCRYAYVQTDLPPPDSYLPCDLYYGCLDGSWNANGDRHWGEPTDGEAGGDVDLLAEVYVGRAPVASVEQVCWFVEKTIRAETQPHPHPNSALLMAMCLGDFPTGRCQGADMFQGLLPLLDRWSLTRLDDQPQIRPQWGRTEAMAALNRSPYVALYNGHGNADILMRMRTPDLARLTNAAPFLVCSVGCSAGEFDHGKFWPDSFGETLVNGGPHGAFAAILNARAGWFDPQYPWQYSGEFQLKLFEELFLRDHRNLGLALQRGKENLIGQVETSGCMTYRWCYYEMTLLGDPHLAFQIPDRASQTDPSSPSDGPVPKRLAAGASPWMLRTNHQ